MKVMAPVSSYQTCVQQIKAGANEIYVGMEDDTFNKISFSGRGKHNNQGRKINPSYEELCNIVKYAHTYHVEVNFTANTILGVGKNGMAPLFYNYVKAAITTGIDRIIIGDLGNIIFLREKGIQMPMVGSVFLSAMNVETINFYKKYGVNRIVLPHHMTIEEIEEIRKSTDMELEIFAGVGCSNIDGRCGFLHNSGECLDLGIPCKAQFRMNGNKIGTPLDSTRDCLICSLIKLYKIGVDVLKIIGRDQDINFTAAMTNIHSEMIKRIKEDPEIAETKLKKSICKIPWWENEFCKNQRCKYKNTKLEKSYV